MRCYTSQYFSQCLEIVRGGNIFPIVEVELKTAVNLEELQVNLRQLRGLG